MAIECHKSTNKDTSIKEDDPYTMIYVISQFGTLAQLNKIQEDRYQINSFDILCLRDVFITVHICTFSQKNYNLYTLFVLHDCYTFTCIP